MFRAEVLKYHGSYNMQILRQDSGRKEKLGEGQTKYMFLTLQWQKSEVSTKGQWKIWYVKSCILFRMLSSDFLLFLSFLLWTATGGNKVTSKRCSFQPSHFTHAAVYSTIFYVPIRIHKSICISHLKKDHTHTHSAIFSPLNILSSPLYTSS